MTDSMLFATRWDSQKNHFLPHSSLSVLSVVAVESAGLVDIPSPIPTKFHQIMNTFVIYDIIGLNTKLVSSLNYSSI